MIENIPLPWWLLIVVPLTLLSLLRTAVRWSRRPSSLAQHHAKVLRKADAARMNEIEYWQEWR